MANSKNKIDIIKGALLAAAGVGVLTTAYLWKKTYRSVPANVTPYSPFVLEKFLGTWYEVARLDHRFERHMVNVTAEYDLKDNGQVSVLNMGYNEAKDRWEQAKAKLKFAGDPSVGAMKVSFFGPLYTGYNVVAIAGDYEQVLIVGRNLDHCWILSRTTDIPEDVRAMLVTKAMEIGVNVNSLIWVEHYKELEETL